MTRTSHESIQLARLGGGLDFWPVIEAAQYAHVVDHDEPRTDAERAAISAFAESFASRTEEWEQRPPEARSTILDDLGRHLDRLAEEGLFLYAGTVEREVSTADGEHVRLPIALLRISRTREPVHRMPLPAEIEADRA